MSGSSRTASGSTAIERWRSALAEWAIPQEILDAAPESPWGHSTRAFAARADRAIATPATPSHRRAAEALPEGGSVLDVGCGAGAASLPLLARASHLVAVDTEAAMLDELRARVPSTCTLTVVQGRWPDVAGDVPRVDVVVCNHVAYNVADLDDAVMRMTEKARRRVVMEMTRGHPRSLLNFLWPLFHGIERPTTPTSADAVDVVHECGLSPGAEEWTPADVSLAAHDVADLVAGVRRAICLDATRDPDIARALASRLVWHEGRVGLTPLPLTTVWWDVARAA